MTLRLHVNHLARYIWFFINTKLSTHSTTGIAEINEMPQPLFSNIKYASLNVKSFKSVSISCLSSSQKQLHCLKCLFQTAICYHSKDLPNTFLLHDFRYVKYITYTGTCSNNNHFNLRI